MQTHTASEPSTNSASKEVELPLDRQVMLMQLRVANMQLGLAEQQARQLAQPVPPAPTPAPAQQPVVVQDPNAGVNLLAAFIAGMALVGLIVTILGVMIWYSLQPPRVLFSIPIGTQQVVHRQSGSVDISMVQPNDLGIDWFNPIGSRVYPLRQLSTGLFVTRQGNQIFVGSDGIETFR